MPRRTPPQMVVVSQCMYKNGVSHAFHELIADISLQLYAVSLTENLWAWQAHKKDNGGGKLCSWISYRRIWNPDRRGCSALVVAGCMFCKSHKGQASKDVSRQGNQYAVDIVV